MDFPRNFLHTREQSNKDNDKNKSITARESQIKSLLDDKTIKEETNSIISFPPGNVSQSPSSEIESKIKKLENKNLSKSMTLPSNNYPQATDNSDFTFPSDHTSTSSSSSSTNSISLSSNEFLNSYDDFNSHSSDSTSTSSHSLSSNSSDEKLQSEKHKRKNKKKRKEKLFHQTKFVIKPYKW